MAKGEVERARNAQDRKVQYVNLVTQHVERAVDVFHPAYKRANQNYRLYRSWKLGKTIPYRSNIAVPVTFSLLQSDVAKKVNLTVPPDNTFVAFSAGGPEDQKLARKRTALVNPQMVDAETFDKSTQLYIGADVFGTQPYKWYWETRRELVKFRADLGTGEAEYAGEAMTFDGPNWEPIDFRNLFPQPGPIRISRMRGVVERFHMDVEDINVLAESGFFDRAGAADVSFDPTMPEQDREDFMVGANPATGGRTELDFKSTDYERPVEILQYWGRVPREMAVDDQVNLVITIAARKHLLRARPNPFGKIPIREYSPMPDPWHWHSPSKAEIAAKLQISTNALASQKVDVSQLFADPQFLYNRRAASPSRRLRSQPGAWHPFDGPPKDNVLPLIPDLRGMQNLYNELEQQMQWMEQGTGVIRDTVQGLGGPDRETARAFLGRQEAANTRLLMEARIAEKQFIEPLAMEFVALNKAFGSFPQQLRILGGNALIDPLTMTPIEDDSIGVNDMLPDYDARAVGTLSGLSKRERLQNLTLLMQMAQSNPILIQLTNWMVLWRQVMRMADVPNPDELMGTDSVVVQAVQNAMTLAQVQGGSSPQAPPQAQAQLPLGGG